MEIPGRDDVSDELVHFLKGDEDVAAFSVLRTILREHRLVGGIGFIKGEYPCVCFTEAPLSKIGPTIAQAARQGRRYRPFGIIVRKMWLYELGGRPVIYGPDRQFDELPTNYRWRHVRYEPNSSPPIDFSWEREWRILTTSLEIVPDAVAVLVHNSAWADRLFAEHDAEQDQTVEQLKLIMNDDLAEQYREAFPWRVQILE